MVTSSYPRFAGDAVATFMEPIVRGIGALGHAVHVVAPWHPAWDRPLREEAVHFHLYRYAPVRALNTFGYAGALKADVRLRASAVAVAPLALASGIWRTRQVARRARAAIVHAHWVIPGGVQGALAAGRRPLVISLHGSDVFVAERHGAARAAARAAFRRAAWVTACSDDLGRRAVLLGAPPDRTTVIPYGVDSGRFRPDEDARRRGRRRLGAPEDVPLVLAFGRLVAKKGFEYLVDATATIRSRYPDVKVVIAGEGDLAGSLRVRAAALGLGDTVQFPGVVPHGEMPDLLAAADVAVVPSVRDAAGNVDGLPNTVLEIMASGVPLVATRAGGIGSVAADGETAVLVPEHDAKAIGDAVLALLADRASAKAMAGRARDMVCREYGWPRVAERFDDIYARVLDSTGAGS